MYRLLPTFAVFFLYAPMTLSESITDIYEMAIDNDPEYLAALAGYEAAKQETAIVSAYFRPSISVSASGNRREVSASPTINASTTDTSSYSANASMSLYSYGNIVANSRANTTIEQAEIALAAAKDDLIIKTAKRYFNVLAAQDNVNFSKAEKQAISRQLDQTKQRFDVGLVAITDVHEAQARYDLSVAQGITSKNLLRNRLEILREITGQYHENLFSLTDRARLIRPKPESIDAWTKMALNQNLQLQITEFNVELAYDSIRSARAGYHPEVSLSVSFQPKDSLTNSATGFTNPSNTINSNISLSYNFYNGGGTSAAVRQAKHYHTQAKEFLEQVKRSTIRKTRNAYLNVIAGISQVKALRQAVVSRKSAQRASEAGFEVGTKTTVDVLNSRRELFSAQNAHTQARYDFILNTLELKKEAGKLGISDLELINTWTN